MYLVNRGMILIPEDYYKLLKVQLFNGDFNDLDF